MIEIEGALKKDYPLPKVSPQARTEGRKDPVVLQWDPWEGHLQVTDKIIVAVNLVVVIVFMVVVVDVVVERAPAGKHHLHRHHHCCRLPPSSSLSSMSTPPDDHISLESQIFSHFCTLTEIDKKKSSQEGSHQQKKDSSVRAAPEQVDQDNMSYKM